MDEDAVKKYLAAGGIAEKAKDRAMREAKPGVKILSLVSILENYIVELGGNPAFPVNVSVNNEAAHRTAYINDESTLPEDGVVKIDIGVHVDGFIADTAITVCFSEKYRELVETTREALEKALRAVKPGIRASEIGFVIEKVVRGRGFKVIRNLSGHSLAEYTIHAGETIPNYRDSLNFNRIRPGVAYAVEPFASTGRGVVYNEKRVNIYSIRPTFLFKEISGEHVLMSIYKKRRTLPFSERWFPELATLLGVDGFRELLKELSRAGYLIPYPVLSDIPGSFVAQFEDTVLVLDDGSVIVTTNRAIL
ncbi:MAG: type II methionyl aminopeptidase [Sulfolobales archaeon]|nr:type II methionyl aminopeptidase [Sulfolobales archaeon]MCX8208986.1 type II methionyl aminopeptidase [Sulfolobales archaeon]MDW8010460.1 type II methionyl aminopeptidase [Sulfolobales archaeon]